METGVFNAASLAADWKERSLLQRRRAEFRHQFREEVPLCETLKTNNKPIFCRIEEERKKASTHPSRNRKGSSGIK